MDILNTPPLDPSISSIIGEPTVIIGSNPGIQEPKETEENTRRLIDDNDKWIFQCPHCDHFVQVMKNQVNCQIFRHAAYKANIDQLIGPHSPKDLCDQLVAQNLVYGCAKPIRMVFSPGGNYIEKCEYI